MVSDRDLILALCQSMLLILPLYREGLVAGLEEAQDQFWGAALSGSILSAGNTVEGAGAVDLLTDSIADVDRLISVLSDYGG